MTDNNPTEETHPVTAEAETSAGNNPLDTDVNVLKEKGNAAFHEKKWQEAVDWYTQALEIDDKNHLLYSNRSIANLHMERFEEALDDANQCIALDPTFYKGYARKGAALHALQRFDEAMEAYKSGLEIQPDEEHLIMGLVTAQLAKMEVQPAANAARKSQVTRRASVSSTRKMQKSETVSAFVQQARIQLQLKIISLQAQLELIEELASLSDSEKMDLLFTIIDSDGDGVISAKELAASLRKRNERLSFAESIERAITMVAAFDANGDSRLDRSEFGELMEVMTKELGSDFHELSEFLIMQLVLSESDGNTPEEELVAMIAEPQIDDAVKDKEEMFSILEDPRLMLLFELFDRDGSGLLSFKEVAVGLYKLTNNMEDSVRLTMDVLLMMDEGDSRTLNYEQFARLILAVVAAAGASFDELADDLTLAMTQQQNVSVSDFSDLVVADAVFGAAKDMAAQTKEEMELADALSYGRLKKLFQLWDKDNDGTISFSELRDGLRKYQAATNSQDDVDLQAMALLGYGDEDGDAKLDPVEFARTIVLFARSTKVEMHDMIDFLCITALADDDTGRYEKAYRRLSSSRAPPRRMGRKYGDAPTQEVDVLVLMG